MPMKHVEVENISFRGGGIVVEFKLTHGCLLGVTARVTVNDVGGLEDAVHAAQLRLRTALRETAEGISAGPLSLSNMG